jgi:RNA polymerase sigma-70 factor (ECF subfamily)
VAVPGDDHHRLRRPPQPSPGAPHRRAADGAVEPEHYDGAFEALIEPLPETARTALRLRFVEDLDYDGMAAALGCSSVAARQRVSTAVRSLRKQVAA